MRESATFDRATIADIQRAAETGIYDIRGGGAKRRVPHFDDLLFLGASMSRYPLEGYRERCDTDVVLGDRRRRLHRLGHPAEPRRQGHRGHQGLHDPRGRGPVPDRAER